MEKKCTNPEIDGFEGNHKKKSILFYSYSITFERSAAPSWLPRCLVVSVKCVFVVVLNDLKLNMWPSKFSWAPTLLFVYFYFNLTNIWRHSDRRFPVQLNGDRSGSQVDPVSSSSSRINYSSSYLKSLGKTMPKQTFGGIMAHSRLSWHQKAFSFETKTPVVCRYWLPCGEAHRNPNCAPGC